MGIRALVMDVDGTLTDGGIYIGKNGECFKKFYVRDGQAIKHKLPQLGIVPIVITGRESEIVQQRCRELDITLLRQNSTDKEKDLVEILQQEHILLEEVAYIGDDYNDLCCMNIVGLKGCPQDAIQEIKQVADFIAPSKGGYGAVRDFIDWIEKNEKNTNS